MSDFQQQLWDKAARMLQESLAADEENRRLWDTYLSEGSVSIEKLGESWDKRRTALRAYHGAMEDFRDTFPHVDSK